MSIEGIMTKQKRYIVATSDELAMTRILNGCTTFPESAKEIAKFTAEKRRKEAGLNWDAYEVTISVRKAK